MQPAQDEADLRSACASLRRNGCFDYTKKDPKALRGYLEHAWNTMVVEAFFGRVEDSNDRRGGDDAKKAVSVRWFERLWSLHTNDPKRHYHTIVHLWEMTTYLMLLVKANDLSCCDGGNSEGGITEQQRNAMFLATFFHDAVYDPKSSTNEEDSALLFQEFASESGLDGAHPSTTQRVTQFIIATKHHHVADSNPIDLALFLDVDMAVLGKDPNAYKSYAGLIREEYRHVPRDVYCAKRADVLEAFLQQPRIYGTPRMRQTLETQARDNVRAEIAALRNGIIYGETADDEASSDPT
jgi:predicted metal-dependent HD superfamily phosphohydrolase